MYLIIQNKGEVDINAFVLMGASTKEGQDKIGFFGSGNKYAIATLLRSGYSILIYSGLKEITLETHAVTLGSQVFEQIYVNGLPTSLTTRMGPEWEVWFALREFICNAKDEGGESISTGEVIPTEGITQVCVEYRDEVETFMTSYNDYILESEPLVSTTEGISLIAKENDQLNIYRKGISVIGKNDFKSLYNYNLNDLEINESRIFKYEFEIRKAICKALSQGTEDIVANFLSHRDDLSYIENDLDYWEQCSSFSLSWLHLLEHKSIYPRSVVQYLPPEDIVQGIVLEDGLCTTLSGTFPSLAIWGKNKNGWVEKDPPEELKENVTKAVEELNRIGMPFKHAIVFGVCTVDSTMATYNRKEDKLWLSIDYLEDYDELVLTLIEENYHTQGLNDGSRLFEHQLMKDLLKAQRVLSEVKAPTENINNAMEIIANLSKALAAK